MMSWLGKLLGQDQAIGKSHEISPLSLVCPYCHKALEKRHRKCPYCKGALFVRLVPSQGKKALVTKKDAWRLDWLGRLSSYGVTEKDFEKRQAELSRQWGKPAGDTDVFWSLLNFLAIKMNDLHDLKILYYEMALFLHEEGHDSFDAAYQARKLELLMYKRGNLVKQVEILTCGDQSCPACQELTGKVLSVDEALAQMPIPHPQCSFEASGKKRGYCRCAYGPTGFAT